MKIAVISITDKGFELSKKIKSKLDCDSTVIKCDLFRKKVKKTFPILFSEYDAIIAVMASGILIRSIASLIESKDKDPAILNIDDNGKFVISALSGHLGGANKLTYKISKILDATPVITTSTDINNKLGIDTLAKDLYFTISDKSSILPINKAILEGEEIEFLINPKCNFDYLYDYLNNNTLEMNLSIYFSSKINPKEIKVQFKDSELILKERDIVVGIGCRKNKSCKDIYEAFKKTLKDLNLPINRVNYLSSAEIKKDEVGILELSKKLNIKCYFVNMNLLNLFTSPDVSKSDFVKSKFGIYGVCEPSALILAGFNSKLIYKKTSFDGVTIAVAVSD